MTRQNKSLGIIGRIRVGGGFNGKIPLRSYDYPPDRLTEFLHLDITNSDKVFEFCSNYQLVIPYRNEEQLLIVVAAQQKNLKVISTKLYKKELLNLSEIELINFELAKIKLEVGYPARDNAGLQNTPEDMRNQFKQHHLSLHKRHLDALAGLWEDLINHFVTKQDIKQCINCGDFFIPMNRHKRFYCSNECGNALKQARHRGRIKKK